MVDQKLTEWQIYNINPSTDNYINEDDMKSCIEYIMKKVVIELSPTAREILSIGYPMNTDEEMLESIKNVAKLAVLNYAVKQNEAQDHDMAIGNINAF